VPLAAGRQDTIEGMKLVVSLLLATASSLTAQPPSPGRPAAHPLRQAASGTGHATLAPSARGGGCVRVPDLSPKIPALPANLPCPHALYTLSTVPAIKLDYIAPIENSSLRDSLGVEPTTFSLAYVDTKVGTGPLAAPDKWYTIHYTGYLTDGTKFDSSVDRNEPISIQYGKHQVIPGWDTGFDGMHVGGKRRLFIPYQLAYGANGRPPIPPKAELIFDVELVAQSDTEPKPEPKPEPPAPSTPPPASAPADPSHPATPPETSAPQATPPPTSKP
jgi:peptidylprolyl isomerase